MDDMNNLKGDLVHLARLALDEKMEDVHLFVIRLSRKYRSTEPDLAEQLDLLFRVRPPRTGTPLRKQEK
jgi:hypothetical protein